MTSAQAESAALQALCQYPHLVAQVGIEPEDFADKRRVEFLGALRETRYFLDSGAASPLEVATRAGLPREWVASEFHLTFSVEVQAKDLVRKLREIAVGERYAAKLREVIARKRGGDLIECVAALTRMFSDLYSSGSDVTDMEAVTLAYMDEAEGNIAVGRQAGLTTGLPTLDKAIRGFRAGELTTLVAPAGSGKSTLLDFWRRHLSLQRIYTILFTGEMTEEQLGERATYAECATSLADNLTDLRGIQDARERITSTGYLRHMMLDARSTVDLRRARSITQSKKAEHGSIGLVGFDHVRHIAVSLGSNAGDTERVAEAIHETKSFAKDCMVHAVVLCHVNRKGEEVEGADGEPNESIILGGPRIRNESDNLLCLWRPKALSTLYVWKGRQTGAKNQKILLEYDLLTQSYSEAR